MISTTCVGVSSPIKLCSLTNSVQLHAIKLFLAYNLNKFERKTCFICVKHGLISDVNLKIQIESSYRHGMTWIYVWQQLKYSLGQF